MKKLEFIFFITILLGAFFLRLYKFDGPVADRHSWRQVDTSSVSRSFVEKGIDFLYPTYHDLSNVPSGKNNPLGYRFVEFPLYNAIQAGFFKLFGVFSLEQWGRLTTIFASLFSITFIFLLVKKYAGSVAALSSAFFYAFLPFNIFYGRSILPDPSMVAASLGGIYFFHKWAENNSKFKIKKYSFYFLSLFLVASAFLLKPYALFFTLPIFVISWNSFGLGVFKKWQLWIFLIISVTPFILWRMWITQYPEGIPASDWLYNKDNIRFKGAFFYHLFAERIGRIILGYYGIGLLMLGIIRKFSQKNSLFFLSFLASSLLYMMVIAGGNVQHDYYQIAIIPTLAIFLGLGVDFLIKLPNSYSSRIASLTVIFVTVIFTLAFGWYSVRDFYNANSSLQTVGNIVDRVLPKHSKIIALHSGVGDTTFLYYTKRSGWASLQSSLPDMVKLGASYLVIANPTQEDRNLRTEYAVFSESTDYILFDLTRKPF